MSTIFPTLLLLLVLYLLAALFCCMETAFTSANQVLLRELAEKKNKAALCAKRLLENAGSFFGTVLLGTNLVHVSITTLVHSVIAVAIVQCSYFQSLIKACGFRTDWESLVTSLIVTPTLLLFTELIPKAIGRSHADSYTLLLAKPLDFFRILLLLPVSIIDFISARLSRLLGTTSRSLGKVSRDDLKILAAVAVEKGLLPKESQTIMNKVLNVDSQPVKTAMVPLKDVKSLPMTACLGEVEALAAETGFTRFPVYEDRVDNLIGYISLRRCILEESLHPDMSPFKISELSIQPLLAHNQLVVPDSQPIGILLAEMSKGMHDMAFVLDEYASTAGIITVEDLIAHTIGGIQDMRNQALSTIRSRSKLSFECLGSTDIRTLENRLGFSIENQGFETAAGLVLKLLGHIPKQNESVQFRNYSIQCLEISENRIRKLLFTQQSKAQQAAEEKLH